MSLSSGRGSATRKWMNGYMNTSRKSTEIRVCFALAQRITRTISNLNRLEVWMSETTSPPYVVIAILEYMKAGLRIIKTELKKQLE